MVGHGKNHVHRAGTRQHDPVCRHGEPDLGLVEVLDRERLTAARVGEGERASFVVIEPFVR